MAVSWYRAMSKPTPVSRYVCVRNPAVPPVGPGVPPTEQPTDSRPTNVLQVDDAVVMAAARAPQLRELGVGYCQARAWVGGSPVETVRSTPPVETQKHLVVYCWARAGGKGEGEGLVLVGGGGGGGGEWV